VTESAGPASMSDKGRDTIAAKLLTADVGFSLVNRTTWAGRSTTCARSHTRPLPVC
jgi:hypothetical protein